MKFKIQDLIEINGEVFTITKVDKFGGKDHYGLGFCGWIPVHIADKIAKKVYTSLETWVVSLKDVVAKFDSVDPEERRLPQQQKNMLDAINELMAIHDSYECLGN